MADFSTQVDRNLKGIQFEKKNDLEAAIELYEMNISEGFVGNHPYDRLAIIYRKSNRISDEIRVLEKAIVVFNDLSSSPRQDVEPKLTKFKKRLEKARKLL